MEYVSLPAGAKATGLSFYAEEKRKAWVAVSCTDGAVRLIDASPERTEKSEIPRASAKKSEEGEAKLLHLLFPL